MSAFTIDVLCIDLGASNGRGIIGSFDGRKLSLNEAHRFGNGPVAIFSHLYWDTFGLYKEVLHCLRAAHGQSAGLRSFGIDGWSQDFGLLDRQGQITAFPRHYRDPRTHQLDDWAAQTISRSQMYEWTGKVPASISTLFQLIAMQRTENAVLDRSHSLLFMPNLLGYFLTGEKNCDVTLASASALYNPGTATWCDEILAAYDLPRLLPEISRPGHTVGTLLPDVKIRAGLSGTGGDLPLISVAQHDTISALLAAHAGSPSHTAYISCGTWSVVGTTVPSPLIHEQAMNNGFCYEPGYYDGMHFVVKYMTGLWILQECIREWAEQGLSFDYEAVQAAAFRSNFSSCVDVEHGDLASPGHMLAKIAKYCRETKQVEPANAVEYFICIVSGLAQRYTRTLHELQGLTGEGYNEIRIVGGGSRNAYLCQLTARLSGIKVVAGPDEASVAGNALAQLIALGEIGDLREAAEVMRQSFEYKAFYP